MRFMMLMIPPFSAAFHPPELDPEDFARHLEHAWIKTTSKV
jgi:hypothetical protein